MSALHTLDLGRLEISAYTYVHQVHQSECKVLLRCSCKHTAVDVRGSPSAKSHAHDTLDGLLIDGEHDNIVSEHSGGA